MSGTCGLAVALVAFTSSVIEAAPLQSESKAPAKAWKLVWNDEFDVNGPPDSTKWSFEKGFVRNRELQWYQPDNANCEKGLLVIEGRRESKQVANVTSRKEFANRNQTHYTSSSLHTRDKFSWKYGRLEVRAKVISSPGLWPAIWTLGEHGNWPANGEVDLMECYQGILLANVAWRAKASHGATWDSTRIPVEELRDDWDEEFHTWVMEWDKNSIKLAVDGRLLNETDLNAIKHVGMQHPFRQSHYLLLNLAIGGTKGGDPGNTAFPSRYFVDYVRVYQKADE